MTSRDEITLKIGKPAENCHFSVSQIVFKNQVKQQHSNNISKLEQPALKTSWRSRPFSKLSQPACCYGVFNDIIEGYPKEIIANFCWWTSRFHMHTVSCYESLTGVLHQTTVTNVGLDRGILGMGLVKGQFTDVTSVSAFKSKCEPKCVQMSVMEVNFSYSILNKKSVTFQPSHSGLCAVQRWIFQWMKHWLFIWGDTVAVQMFCSSSDQEQTHLSVSKPKITCSIYYSRTAIWKENSTKIKLLKQLLKHI